MRPLLKGVHISFSECENGSVALPPSALVSWGNFPYGGDVLLLWSKPNAHGLDEQYL